MLRGLVDQFLHWIVIGLTILFGGVWARRETKERKRAERERDQAVNNAVAQGQQLARTRRSMNALEDTLRRTQDALREDDEKARRGIRDGAFDRQLQPPTDGTAD